MGFNLKISFDTRKLEREMEKLRFKDIPKGTADAVNHLANGAKIELEEQMEKVFDKPTKWTLGAFRVQRGTVRNPTAILATKDNFQPGNAAGKYLAPEVFGSSRVMKKSEKALRTLSEGQYWIPGKDAPLNEYGNISAGEIRRIISRFGLSLDPKDNTNYESKTMKRLKKRGKFARGQRQGEYFIAYEKGSGRPRGIYKYSGTPGKILNVLNFTPSPPRYKIRLPAEKIVNDYATEKLDSIIAKTLANFL